MSMSLEQFDQIEGSKRYPIKSKLHKKMLRMLTNTNQSAMREASRIIEDAKKALNMTQVESAETARELVEAEYDVEIPDGHMVVWDETRGEVLSAPQQGIKEAMEAAGNGGGFRPKVIPGGKYQAPDGDGEAHDGQGPEPEAGEVEAENAEEMLASTQAAEVAE